MVAIALVPLIEKTLDRLAGDRQESSGTSRLRSGMKHLGGGTAKATVALGALPYAPLMLAGTIPTR
jgi:hypothetical protein